MNKVPKLIFITCYFGDFPWYFPLFLKSCEFNPDIEFKLYSDRTWEGILPANRAIFLEDINGYDFCYYLLLTNLLRL